MTMDGPEHEANTAARFSDTKWSAVIAARSGPSPAAEAALDRLCTIYWYPIYAFLRRKGCSPHRAEDLTQGFFAQMLRREWLKNVGPEKGRFRTFVLRCLCNFTFDQREKVTVFTVDFTDAESRYGIEPTTDITPERLLELRWATAVLDQALAKLRAEYSATGKSERFDVLLPYLTKENAPGGFALAAARLSMSEESVRQEASRMRKAYRDAIRKEITDTVASPDQVAIEYNHLKSIFRG
jgi:DNA-directed RNA polymerase specialized sigma24 family protein